MIRAWLAAALASCAGTTTADRCGVEPGEPEAVGPAVGLGTTDASGLAASRMISGLLWTHGDAGDPANVFAVRATDARPGGLLRLNDATNVDWEDIAVAPCGQASCLYIADTGDNDLSRSSVAIYQVTEPLGEPGGSVDTVSHRFELVYPDGQHDVEALFVDPRDSLAYGIEKVADNPVGVYLYPRMANQIATAVRIAALQIPHGKTQVTAADMFVGDICAVVLVRTRTNLFAFEAATDASVDDVLSATPLEWPVADELQGEAIAFGSNGSEYLTTSEGASPTVWRVGLHR
jgi:hypothetical protein